MKEINVLILSAGRRVELVNCFKNARDRLKIAGKIFAADIVKTAPALYFADEHFIIPHIKDENFISELIKLCKDNNVNLVVPTIDTELEILAKNRNYIESNADVKVMVSDYDLTKACCDKILTAELLSKNGFSVPKVIDGEALKSNHYDFPLFIKPLDGSSSINAFKVNSQKELDFFKDYVKNPIIQSCVSGKEYTVDCFCDFEGKPITVVPRIRLATRGGEVLKGKLDRNKKVIENILKLLAKFKFYGHITVQGFLEEDDTFNIIEINPRFGGGAPMSIAAGADSCENLYRLLLGERLIYNENWEDGIVISRFDSSIRVEE